MSIVEFERPGDRPPLRISSTPDRPSITPASRLCLAAIDANPGLLGRRGIDWGSGSGILAVAAATLPGVELVVGLEIDADEVRTARTNAELNGVADRTAFIHADLFDPFPSEDAGVLDGLAGIADFLVANPPTSSGDDGLGWRRAVLAGAARYLRGGATALVQVSRQYGPSRTEALGGTGYRYAGLVAASDWTSFDLRRADLLEAIRTYAAEEARGGERYPFLDATGDRELGATEALDVWEADGLSPRSQWQVHRYERVDR